MLTQLQGLGPEAVAVDDLHRTLMSMVTFNTSFLRSHV